MYFKRLEMHGFKSFAEPVIIDFHEGITAIVGPNGSGKSNISDALRWVLGEQSPKALRGGKMEEVIFNGTENRRPRGMAEVTLVIDNSAGILDIEYQEVAITRRMFRSGESEYQINGNPCRLKDIRSLIMDTGIGVDGYSLIGQGKISDIVSNKPESRREIFEEAAGIVAYKGRKAEAERKLSGTKANLERIDDIIYEIESRIDGLRDDSVKAKRYLELREQYRDLEINLTLRNIENAKKHNEQYQADIEELTSNLNAMTENRQRAEIESKGLQERNTALDAIWSSSNEKRLENLEAINRITGENDLMREKLAGFERERARLTEEIDALEVRKKEMEDEAERIRIDQKDLEESSETAKKELDTRVLRYQEMTSASKKFTDIIDENNEKIIVLNSAMATSDSEAKSYENYRDTLLKRDQQLGEEYEKLAEEIQQGEKTLDQTRQSLIQEQQKQKSYLETDQRFREKLASKRKDEERLRMEIENLKIENSQMQTRRRVLKELEENFEGYNGAVKFIMRMSLKGIEGVVGDLISVPQGFETAIETALGGQLQNIITADDESARRAITALKVNKSGRLTFLPVTSIQSKRREPRREITEHHGYQGLAADLIRFDSRYRTIFDYLLGRVIVVDNLDAAIYLSKKAESGFRFVTLDGEIINASGAITGGHYKNKSANLLERKNEIQTLRKTIDSLDERIRAKDAAFADQQEALEVLVQDQRENEERMRELSVTIAQRKEKGISLSATLEDQKKSLAQIEHEKQDIARQVSNMEEQIQKMQTESRTAKSQIAEISSQMDLLSEQHQAGRAEAERANQEITNARIEVTRMENEREHLHTMAGRIAQDLSLLLQQMEQRKDQLAQIETQQEEMEKGFGSTDSHLDSLTKERHAIEESLEEISKEKAEVGKRLSAVMESLSKMEGSVSDFRDQKFQLELKIARGETQLENMKEKLWDEFEISFAQAVDLRKEDFQVTAATRAVREVKRELREIGDVNLGSIEEYEQVSKRYDFLSEQRTDVVTAMQELETIITSLDRTITTSFRDNFNRVEENFEHVFQELFHGGHAELRLEDEKDPLESGIEIVAQPPGKKLQNINLLSGGEKTMTAIALMFAVLKTKPTPFCILDEVEAALDDENIDRFSSYLKHFHETQFALITHQKATMEHADVLYGITMPERGISKVLSLRMGDYDPDDYVN